MSFCLKNLADLIVNSSWYENREKDLAKESERIISAAAKLILSDIRSMNLDNEFYPSEEEISDITYCESLQPESLRTFLEVLIKGRLNDLPLGKASLRDQKQDQQYFHYHLDLGLS